MDPLPPTPPVSAPPPPAAPQPPPEPSPAERRIGQLYGQMKQEQEQRQAAEQAATELRSQLAELHEEVTLLKAQRPTQQAPASAFGVPPVVPPSSGTDTDAIVEKAVQRVVGPFMQEARDRETRAALQTQQQQAFAKAAQEFPDVAQAGSELNRLADQIWRSDKALQALPHGPYLAVLAARGALGVSPTVPVERKVAAMQVGAGPGTGGVQSPNAPEVARLDAEIANLASSLQTGMDAAGRRVDPARTWVQLRTAKIRRAKLVNDPNLGSLPDDVAKAWGIQ